MTLASNFEMYEEIIFLDVSAFERATITLC